MSGYSVSKFTIQLATIGALVALSSGVAAAQKAKGGPPPTTHGEVKAALPAAKGQENAAAKRTDAAADKATNVADKKEDKAENKAIASVRSEPTSLLKGIKLSKAERKAADGIEKKFDGQIKDLEKQENAAEKAGAPDASIMTKIDALRSKQRADLRAVLTPAQQAQFDKNAATLGSKK